MTENKKLIVLATLTTVFVASAAASKIKSTLRQKAFERRLEARKEFELAALALASIRVTNWIDDQSKTRYVYSWEVEGRFREEQELAKIELISK